MELVHAFVLGGGNMGAAFARGIISTNLLQPDSVTVIDPDVSKGKALKSELDCHFRTAFDPTHILSQDTEDGQVLVVCAVKPDLVSRVLQSVPLANLGSPLVISCAAGIRLKSLRESLSGHPFIIRAMPNLPVQVREGVIGFYAPRELPEELWALGQQVLRALGLAIPVDREELLDAVTAVSGSGPGYWAYLISSVVEQTRNFGFSEEDSHSMVLQTLRGTLALLELGESPARLQARVTSPGGTTAQAIATLNRTEVAHNIRQALQDACDKAEELGG